MSSRWALHLQAWLLVYMVIWLTECAAECPKQCKCSHAQVSCIARGLEGVPSPIPVETVKLNLHHNRIRILSSSSLAKLPYLLTLDLSSNQIPGLIETAFKSNKMLERLTLSSNQLPAVPKAIRHLRNLRYIHLGTNRIKSVSASDFRGLVNLQEIILLSNPLLSYIHKDAFNNLRSLRKVMIGYCNLHTIDSNLFKNKNVQAVGLYSNPWRCDCRLKWLWYWMSTANTTFDYRNDIKCTTPALFEGFPVHSLKSGAFKCEGVFSMGSDSVTISTDTTQWGVQDRTRVLAGEGGLTDIHSSEFQEFAVTVCASVAASAVFLVLLGCASVWLRKAWRQRKVLTKQKRNDAILFQYIKTQGRRSYLPPYWVHEPPPQYTETPGQADTPTIQIHLHQRSHSHSSGHEASANHMQVSSNGESMTADQQQPGDAAITREQSDITRNYVSIIATNQPDNTREKDLTRSSDNFDAESESSDVYVDCSEDFLDETVVTTGLTREGSLRQAWRNSQRRASEDRHSLTEREMGASGLTREESLRHALRSLQRRSQGLDTPLRQPKQLSREDSLRQALRSLQQRQRHSFHLSSPRDNRNSTPDLHVANRQEAHFRRSLRDHRGWSYNEVSDLHRNSSERSEDSGTSQPEGLTQQCNFSPTLQTLQCSRAERPESPDQGLDQPSCNSLGAVSTKQSRTRAAREERLREALKNLRRSFADENSMDEQNYNQTGNIDISQSETSCQAQPDDDSTEKEMVTSL